MSVFRVTEEVEGGAALVIRVVHIRACIDKHVGDLFAVLADGLVQCRVAISIGCRYRST